MLRDLSDGDGRRAPGRKPSNYMSWRPRSSLVSGRHASRAVKRLGSPAECSLTLPQHFTVKRSAWWSVSTKSRVARAKPPHPRPQARNGPRSGVVARRRRRSTCRGHAERRRPCLPSNPRAVPAGCHVGAAGSMLDRLVLCLVGRFPRAARPVHIGFSIRIWIRLIPLCIRPVGICAICHEHQRANDNDGQLCFHDDALCQAIRWWKVPALLVGGTGVGRDQAQ
jgi:hypothetical protein